MDLGHWNYPGEFNIGEWFGFIYRIIDNTNEMEYIGKKQFCSIKRKSVKYRKNKIVTKTESDWKTYTGSSEYLNDAILKKGKENFTFLIESLHKSKGSLHYMEIETQIDEDVLRTKLDNGERKFYNRSIAGIKFLVKDRTDDEISHKTWEILKERRQNTANCYFKVMSEEEKNAWNKKYRIGENNPMYNKKHSDSAREKQRLVHKDKPLSEDHRRKLSKVMSGENNPMFGKSNYDVWLQKYGKEIADQKEKERSEKISKESKNKPKSEKHKQSLCKPTGAQKKGVCIYCSKECGISALTRFHNENCKKKPK